MSFLLQYVGGEESDLLNIWHFWPSVIIYLGTILATGKAYWMLSLVHFECCAGVLAKVCASLTNAPRFNFPVTPRIFLIALLLSCLVVCTGFILVLSMEGFSPPIAGVGLLKVFVTASLSIEPKGN